MEQKLTRVQKFCALMLNWNPEFLAQCHIHDRLACVRYAALLGLTAFASGIAWVGYTSLFLPIYVAIPCGIFACCYIYLIDLSISAADWMLRGILQRPGAVRDWMQRFGLMVRFLMTLVLSTATSTGAAQWLSQKAIAQQRLADVRAQDYQIDDEAAKRVEGVRLQRLGNEEGAVQQELQVVNSTTPLLDQACSDASNAAATAKEAAAEADRELHGGNGYKAGAGRNWRAARDKQLAAEVDLARENAKCVAFQERATTAQTELEAARERLRQAEQAIMPQLQRIEEERIANQVKDESDPMINGRVFGEVLQDSKLGSTARGITWTLMAVLMIIEIGYIVVRLVFEPANIHTLLLNKETKLDAYRHMADYERRIYEMDKLRPIQLPREPRIDFQGD